MASEAQRTRATESANKARQPSDGTGWAEKSTGRKQLCREPLKRPWAIAVAVAFPLALAYLIAAPPAGDLAAATYRSDLFARVGFTTWDTGWYAAHGYWLPAYSLLSPALGALLGVRLLLALSALAASILFALIAERVFDIATARIAAAWFALGVCVGLLSGRVPYDLGFAIGLGAVLAAIDGRWAWAFALAVLTSAASPVAGAFLALAAVAGGLGVVLSKKGCPVCARGLVTRTSFFKKDRARTRGTPQRKQQHPRIHLALLRSRRVRHRPDPGPQPRLSRGRLRAVCRLCLLAGTRRDRPNRPAAAPRPAHSEGSPPGASRRRPICARLDRCLRDPHADGRQRGTPRTAPRRTAARRRPVAEAPCHLVRPGPAAALLAAGHPDPRLHLDLGRPVGQSLLLRTCPGRAAQLAHDRATIVEVPLTKAHWEAAYLAAHDGIELARGWERQLDTRYAAIFYQPTLSPAVYRAWLAENEVQYVALPDAPLDKAGSLEGALIARGLPYLRALWHSKHWRIYRVMG